MTNENHAIENARGWFAEIEALVKQLNEATIDEEREYADRAIQEGPLSVLVRDGWRSPGAASDDGAEEYEILLSTGGPALRIYGRLNQHDEPESAVLQWQDWGTPWTDWYPADEELSTFAPESATKVGHVARTLLAYAQCFYFGG